MRRMNRFSGEPAAAATTLVAAGPEATALAPRAGPSRATEPGGARQALLRGPVLPTMLRLALPIIAVLVVQTLVGIAETYFVSSLGTDALAGVALVFPVFMLMTMMSNGGIGGGVASAVARAIGANRPEEADALVLHALVLAVVFGLLFTAAAICGGPAMYRALGGSEGALSAALTYSNVVFLGAVLIWVVNLLAAALRGAGNVRVPALVSLSGALVTIALSPALIFGFGPLPSFGIAGAGLAVVTFYVFATAALVRYMASGRSGLQLRLSRLRWSLFRNILDVGALSALGTVQTNLTVVLVTGIVGLLGVDALAGYGAASRLDYVLIPLLFGLGTAVVTMVGTNIGAGQIARARRIAWTGAFLAAAVTEVIGLAAAVSPKAWMGLFSGDASVIETGSLYLRSVAPFYGFIGLGMLLYFAGQGAGRVTWPFLAGTARLLIAAALGWLIVARFGGSLVMLFLTVSAGAVVFGVINALAMTRLR